MSTRLPEYYTALAPFRDAFRGGTPILTYHKFGPPPRGARLRGLHVRDPLFRAQLAEWRRQGFGCTTPSAAAEANPPASPPRLVLTIDDGFRSVHERALPLLAEYRFYATLYLVVDRLGAFNDWEIAQGEVRAPLMSDSEVREWLAAGQRLGAHTRTHPWLTRIPTDQAREEIRTSRLALEDRFGVAVTDFCYPYGDWNPAVREMVRDAGYLTAATTDAGVNLPGADAWGLKRFTARHASRGWRAVRAWWRRKLGL